MIIPLFKASGGLMGKMTGAIQGGLQKSPLGTFAKSRDELRRQRFGEWRKDLGDKAANKIKKPERADYGSDDEYNKAVRSYNRRRSMTRKALWLGTGESFRQKKQLFDAAATDKGTIRYAQSVGEMSDKSLGRIVGDQRQVSRAVAAARASTSEATKKARDAAYVNAEHELGANAWNNLADLESAFSSPNLTAEQKYAIARRRSEIARPGADIEKLFFDVQNETDLSLKSDMIDIVRQSNSFAKDPTLSNSMLANAAQSSTPIYADTNAFRTAMASKIGDKFSPQAITSVDPEALKSAIVSAALTGNNAELNVLKGYIDNAMADPELNRQISGEVRKVITDMYTMNPIGPWIANSSSIPPPVTWGYTL